jgi:hypothetical protein
MGYQPILKIVFVVVGHGRYRSHRADMEACSVGTATCRIFIGCIIWSVPTTTTAAVGSHVSNFYLLLLASQCDIT